MAKSQFTRYFNSPHLQTDEEDREYFLFPDGTSREEIIDTLEAYLEFRGFSRAHTYEVIGDTLNSNCFREEWDKKLQGNIDVSFGAIQVRP